MVASEWCKKEHVCRNRKLCTVAALQQGHEVSQHGFGAVLNRNASFDCEACRKLDLAQEHLVIQTGH